MFTLTDRESEFINILRDYQGQPNIFLLIISHIKDPDYQAIAQVALTESEAKDWANSFAGEGLKRSYKKILVYKKE